MLNIDKNITGEKLDIVLEGRLDTTTTPELETNIKSSLDGINEVVFHLDSLDYISSAGLRVLLSTQKTMTKRGGNMLICGCNEDLMEFFDITGFIDILNFED